MLDLIVNPIAGGKGGLKMKKNLELIESRLKERHVDYSIHFTSEKKQASSITESLIKNGSTTIVAVGGDGSLHEIINGFCDFDKCSLAIIPCGTGNDFASSVKIPLDPVKAVDLIVDGSPKYTDFIQLPNFRTLNIAGMGIDVEVLKKYESLHKKTKFGYTKCLIKTLFSFKPIDFEANIDGKVQNFSSYIACVANGKMFGGGLEVCPIAKEDDGFLDFVAMDKMNKIKLIFAFIKLKKGKLLSLKQAHHILAKNINIKANNPYTVNSDGELYENAPFNAQVITNTLRIYR